jgi:hypothetical protein
MVHVEVELNGAEQAILRSASILTYRATHLSTGGNIAPAPTVDALHIGRTAINARTWLG